MSSLSATSIFSRFYRATPILSTAEVICKEPIEKFSDLIKWLIRNGSATYDKSGKLQCRMSCNRSIEDICHCARHHLGFSPAQTIKALARELKDSKKEMFFFFCGDINRFVCSYSGYYTGESNIQYTMGHYCPNYPHKPHLAYNALVEQLKKII